MPACGNDDVLLSFPYVSHWRRLSAGRKAALPEFLARLRVERTQIVVQRRADEDEARCRDDRPTKSRQSRPAQDVLGEGNNILRGSERHRPENASIMHVDCVKLSPGRRVA